MDDVLWWFILQLIEKDLASHKVLALIMVYDQKIQKEKERIDKINIIPTPTGISWFDASLRKYIKAPQNVKRAVLKEIFHTELKKNLHITMNFNTCESRAKKFLKYLSGDLKKASEA
jgi:hypothetical protein